MDSMYDYEYFKGQVLKLTKIDLNAYKEKQMKRRIDTLIAKYKITGYDKFLQKLKEDKAVFDDFVNYLTINVSEFYRNTDQWKLMDENVIPKIDSANPTNKDLKLSLPENSLPMMLISCGKLLSDNLNVANLKKETILNILVYELIKRRCPLEKVSDEDIYNKLKETNIDNYFNEFISKYLIPIINF